MERPTGILAQNLQRLREERNFSLAQLSELTGVSKSMLRQIEIGQSSPTIATLWKIANGLRVPFTALLRKQQSEVTLRAFKGDEPLAGESEGYRVFPLVLFDPHRPFEIYYLEMDPQTSVDADPHSDNAEEHMFVIQGQMEITVNDRCHTVSQDQFMSFAADCVHQYQNVGRGMVAAIMMISYLS